MITDLYGVLSSQSRVSRTGYKYKVLSRCLAYDNLNVLHASLSFES